MHLKQIMVYISFFKIPSVYRPVLVAFVTAAIVTKNSAVTVIKILININPASEI
jgi:hypothetical protein